MVQKIESPFKPIVSGSDYLSGSPFGQVAGALLAKNKEESKQALLASAVLETLGTYQRNLKQDVIDSSNDVKEEFADIFERNTELYNNPINANNRKNYQLYKLKPTEYLHNIAVTRFNADPDLVRELGANPWSAVTKENLDSDDYNTAMKIYNSFIEDEKISIENLGMQDVINKFTLTEYNKPAKDAYNAAMNLIKDDPTKQNIVRNLWNKIFKTKTVTEKNRARLEKRFPEAFKGQDIKIGDVINVNTDVIDLTNNLKLKREILDAQLTSETLLTTPQNKEETEINDTIEQNDEVNKTAIAIYGSSGIERTYNFTTIKENLELEKQNFVTKVNKKDYIITEEDIGKAIELNVGIPGFPGLKNILASDREDLLSAMQKINSNPEFRPFSPEVGLKSAEQRVFALSLNQNPTAMLNNELKLRQTQAEMNKVINIDPEDVDSYFSNEQINQRVTSSILSYMSDNINDNTFNYEGNLSGTEQNGFTYHVIEGALQLQQINKNLSFDDAILQAIPIQATGIYKYKDKPFFKTEKRADLYRTEFVNMEVIDFMENKTLNDIRDARTAVEYLNTKKYIQNRVVNNETGETLVPAKDKEFSQDGFRFFTINVGSEAAPLYKWTFEPLPTQ